MKKLLITFSILFLSSPVIGKYYLCESEIGYEIGYYRGFPWFEKELKAGKKNKPHRLIEKIGEKYIMEIAGRDFILKSVLDYGSNSFFICGSEKQVPNYNHSVYEEIEFVNGINSNIGERILSCSKTRKKEHGGNIEMEFSYELDKNIFTYHVNFLGMGGFKIDKGQCKEIVKNDNLLFMYKIPPGGIWGRNLRDKIHSIYNGQVKNGKPHGQGTNIWYNDTKYVGEWKDGKQNGRGTWTIAKGELKGSKHEGEYKDGFANGLGTYIRSNGNKFEGEFKDGKFFTGTVVDKDGNFIEKYVQGLKQ